MDEPFWAIIATHEVLHKLEAVLLVNGNTTTNPSRIFHQLYTISANKYTSPTYGLYDHGPLSRPGIIDLSIRMHLQYRGYQREILMPHMICEYTKTTRRDPPLSRGKRGIAGILHDGYFRGFDDPTGAYNPASDIPGLFGTYEEKSILLIFHQDLFWSNNSRTTRFLLMEEMGIEAFPTFLPARDEILGELTAQF